MRRLRCGRCVRAATNFTVADDDAIADARHPYDGDDAPLGLLLGDQDVGRGDGRAHAQLPIADLRLERGVFGG
jgi:hypothetical protein